ncbi:hypothetical protein USB125703_00621 [Pseudoclavibacter triregionum]|nr:hypothetical protein USB125703_00621 [Pseudoclavibacter triregionum]
MTRVSESAQVGVGVERVFPLFTDLETLPRMLSFIESVTPVSPDTTHWVVGFAGQRKAFDARLVAQEPNRLLRWESATPGQPFTIEARTEATGPDSTNVTIDAEFDAGGMAERLGLAKPIASKALRDELGRAKLYVERRFIDG